ncbi:ANTAR domain-containing protein [Streptomyces sp. SGAir0957]
MTATAEPAAGREQEAPPTRAALEREIAQLREAVVSHADVDQAIGVIVARAHLPPEQAWKVLVEISQRTNTKLRQVATLIVRWGHTGILPGPLHRELTHHLGLIPPPDDHPASPRS